jgi:hypothetical protein
MTVDLQPWIVAHRRRSLGKDWLPQHADFVSAFKRDPELLAHATAELQRLYALDISLSGKLNHRDHNQFALMETIRAMLSTFNEVMKNERISSVARSRGAGRKPAKPAGKPAAAKKPAARGRTGGRTGKDRTDT